HVVSIVLQGILGVNFLFVLFILGLVLLGVLNHLLYLLFAQPSLVICDGYLVLLASCLVFGRHIQDTVGINVKADSDLRDSPRGRRDSRQLKFAKEIVVPGPCPLTLIDLNQHTRLVIGVGGEDLLLLGRNGGVPWDEHCHHTSRCLETKRQWSHIKEKKILHLLVPLSTKDSSLDGSTVCHSFIRVNALAEFLPIEEILQKLLNPRDSS
ncbi:Os03g0821150, partial [Oryza sativa Japonica Group]